MLLSAVARGDGKFAAGTPAYMLPCVVETIIHNPEQPCPFAAYQSMTDTLEFHSHSEAETEQFGARFARALQPGTVVALIGNLGAGKTRLVQSIVAAMGFDRRQVNSPTFVLIHEYDTSIPIYHFDTYRLRDSDEFLELGSDELMDSEGICLIEWADRVADVLPSDVLTVRIEITGTESRTFRISASGEKSREVVRLLDNS